MFIKEFDYSQGSINNIKPTDYNWGDFQAFSDVNKISNSENFMA